MATAALITDSALAQAHTDGQRLVDEAKRQFDQQNYKAAAAHIALALSLAPDNLNLMRLRLIIAEAALDHREAALACERLASFLYHQHGGHDKAIDAPLGQELKELYRLQCLHWQQHQRPDLALASVKNWLWLDDMTAAADDEAVKSRAGHLAKLGYLLHQLHENDAALAAYQAAVKLTPDDDNLLANWLIMLKNCQKTSLAVEAAQHHLAQDQQNHHVAYVLANLLADLPPEEAQKISSHEAIIGYYQFSLQALLADEALEKNHKRQQIAEYLSNYAVYLNRQRLFHDAWHLLTSHDAMLQPFHAELAPLGRNYYNISGLVLRNLRRYAAAQQVLEFSLGHYPDDDETRFSLSLLLLQQQFSLRGWQLYEARIGHRMGIEPETKIDYQLDLRLPAKRLNDLALLTNKRLLLTLEQGHGDCFQFARFIPNLSKFKPNSILLYQRLPSLCLTSLWPDLADVMTIIDDIPAEDRFDYHCPMLSLPMLWAQQGELTLPPALALQPLVEDKLRWRDFLNGLAAGAGERLPIIGLVQRGRPSHVNDAARSIAFDHLWPWLLQQTHVHILLLQQPMIDGDEAFLANHNLPSHIHRLPPKAYRDFADSAALLSQLDHLISVDTVFVHLAAAVECPVTMLVAAQQDWRWGLSEASTAWYPNARFKLHRQQLDESWGDCLGRLRLATKC